MKGKAKDICPKCKHCEGLDRFRTMYSCKHYNNYPDSAIGMDSEIECCNFEEVNMNKIEGKVSDWCPNCKNCKGVTRESNGVHVWLTEVECEDPYDGMTKTLATDSDICCTLFEVRKEKEPFNLNMPREAIKAIAKLNNIISELEKEKADHLKGIERLKKSQEKLQNQVKNLQTTNEESYKRKEKLKKANELAESWKRDYERLRDQFIYPIYNILYPDNPNIDINVTDLLNDVKNLKVYSEENGTMYKEIQEWREKCIARGIDIYRLLSVIKEKDKKISELEARVKYWGDIATGSAGQIINFKDEITKLNQTVSDQEVTIKALLITIKEMCKEDETNA